MYWRRCGSVMLLKICQLLAPSMRAASTTSRGRLCRPASRMSIMKGVHCQTSAAMIDHSGLLVIQSGWGASGPKTHLSRPLKRPYSGL